MEASKLVGFVSETTLSLTSLKTAKKICSRFAMNTSVDNKGGSFVRFFSISEVLKFRVHIFLSQHFLREM